MPTGSGKTLCFSEILKSAHTKGKRALLIARGRKLISQASIRLLKEGVPHGIMMAQADRSHDSLIKICSIDTLSARRLKPEVDLIIIDEVHQAVSNSYRNFIAQYPSTQILGVTATPFVNQSLRHVADHIVKPVTMKQLIDLNYLVPLIYYAPAVPDLSHVKISRTTKDYDERDLSEEMAKPKIVGDIIDHWKRLGENRPTLCFAVTVRHSKMIVDSFNAQGIPAVHCDASSPDDYRSHCIDRLVSGQIKILSNVGIFGIGVDIPEVSCMILARPTTSLALYFQQCGRGTRIAKNKSNCLVLDHAGNVLKHGFVTTEHDPQIDGKPSKKRSISILRCPQCFAVIEGWPCECGYQPKESSRKLIEHVSGELRAFNEQDLVNKIKKEVQELEATRQRLGFKKGYVWAKIAEKYGSGAANFYTS